MPTHLNTYWVLIAWGVYGLWADFELLAAMAAAGAATALARAKAAVAPKPRPIAATGTPGALNVALLRMLSSLTVPTGQPPLPNLPVFAEIDLAVQTMKTGLIAHPPNRGVVKESLKRLIEIYDSTKEVGSGTGGITL